MPLTFTTVRGDWRVIVGTRITTPDSRDQVAGTVEVEPVFPGGYIADDITYSVQPLTLPVVGGLLFDEQNDPDIRLATSVDGAPIKWRAIPRIAHRGRDLGLPRFTFNAADAIDGTVWLSALPALA